MPQPPAAPRLSATEKPPIRGVALLAGAAGLVLFVIGLRFLLTPEAATRTFGLGAKPTVDALGGVIGLRDLWLGGLAITLAVLREWRALALWLLLGAGVCFGDAALVAFYGSGLRGQWAALAFHLGSGVFCGLLGWRCWQVSRRPER